MLHRLSIKGRMLLIIGAIAILFLTMSIFAVRSSRAVLDLGLEKSDAIMLQDQQNKVQVASHTIALALGHAIEGIADEGAKIETIRRLIDDIRFEKDNSGYYFVCRDTTVVALPPKKSLQGDRLSGYCGG